MTAPKKPPVRVLRGALLALLTAGLSVWAVRAVSPSLYLAGSPAEIDTIQSGEMLLHRVNYGPWVENFHLPLASVSGALIVKHGYAPFWRASCAAAAFLLMLALGVELGSSWSGLLGAAFLLVSAAALSRTEVPTAAWYGQWGHLQSFHALLVLALAAAAARYARAPSLAGAAAVAAACGAALLYRSTLLFFPPLTGALYLWWRRGRARDWRQAALLGLAPYLFLGPWIAFNWSVHGGFVPLERAEAAPVVVGGVMGDVDKDQTGAKMEELGLKDAGAVRVLGWAAGRVASHPADYARSCLRRLRRIAGLRPFLLLLAVASLWRHRRRPEFQITGLLGLYFLAIHSGVSLLVEYFEPLWPVLAVLAGALITLPAQTPETAERRSADATLWGFQAASGALCLFVCVTLASYARAVGDAETAGRRLDEALARHPDEGELYAQRGTVRARAGDYDGAAADYAAAARLLPGNERILRRGAWFDLYAGRGEAFRAWRALPASGDDAQARLLTAFGSARSGTALGRSALSADLEPELLPVIAALCARVRARDAVCREAAARALVARRREAGLLIEAAARAEHDGRRDEARRLLARAALSSPDSDGRQRIAALEQRLSAP